MHKSLNSGAVTNRIIRDRALDSWVKLRLTTPQLKSLLYVTRHGKVNLSGLASGIGVTPANVTGIVDRLVQQGLLTRTSDSDDRRVLWLGVTDKGKALVEDLEGGEGARDAQGPGELDRRGAVHSCQGF